MDEKDVTIRLAKFAAAGLLLVFGRMDEVTMYGQSRPYTAKKAYAEVDRLFEHYFYDDDGEL